jgi:Ca2+-binding RTX toxin-like protein
MICLTRKRLLIVAACGLLVWVSFGALAAANTVESSSASDTISEFNPEPPEDGLPPECNSIPAGNHAIGTNGPDLLFGGNNGNCVAGLGGDDVLNGGNSSDILVGGSGNDTLHGGNSSDRLYGGSGDDILYGENGNDHLDGGPGWDICYGGNGTDTFVNCEVMVQ